MNKIKFYPLTHQMSLFAPPPIPAEKMLPDWYKEMSVYINNNKNLFSGPEENGGGHNQHVTAKKCISIFDTLSSGYYLLSPVDIYFDTTGENVVYKWRNPTLDLISIHTKDQMGSYPKSDNYIKESLRWLPSYMIETPPGYSILVTHPHHRQDLPFYTLPGIVDSDNLLAAGALPFELKKGYQGIIKKGTPIALVMPFKREEWSHEIFDEPAERFEKEAQTINSSFLNVYKDNYWERKRFT